MPPQIGAAVIVRIDLSQQRRNGRDLQLATRAERQCIF
jgi:hypothetical protein